MIDLLDAAGLEIVEPARARPARRHGLRRDSRPSRPATRSSASEDRLRLPARRGRDPPRPALLQQRGRAPLAVAELADIVATGAFEHHRERLPASRRVWRNVARRRRTSSVRRRLSRRFATPSLGVRQFESPADGRGMRRLFLLVLVVLALSAGSSAARTAQATVSVYPSGTTFTASGAAPAGAGSSVSLAMPVGGVDDATILVRGAQNVSIVLPAIDAPLQLNVFFAHFVSVDGKAVPDALMPWDGSQRSTEEPNQPLWLQVAVPYGTAPGSYSGSVYVVADGTRSVVPIRVTVAPVTLPKPNQVSGSLLTAFNFSPQSYSNKAASLYGVAPTRRCPGSSASSLRTGCRRTAGATGTRRPLRLHERPALVARQNGADGGRRRAAQPVRVDVDPDLEQPLEPEHVRRPPVAVRAATPGARTCAPCTASGRSHGWLAGRIRTCGGWTSPGRREVRGRREAGGVRTRASQGAT